MSTIPSVNLPINGEFIKLARSMRDAQVEGQHSQKAQRRARSLEQLFDSKLVSLEKELARLQSLVKQQELPLPGAEQKGDQGHEITAYEKR